MAFIVPTVVLTSLYTAIFLKMRSRQNEKISLAKKGMKRAKVATKGGGGGPAAALANMNNNNSR